ncbi:Mesotocin receptor isoform 2 [Schistosoma japonicum]|uniref:Mesotocin receptor isoform 2 n=1 Tax=Schistosoma japonicum TaxID=6182 RepID=A0A4Z2DXK4_SCHJA|nr:Mesotocin receptor isoform 2 [Schistosoma japonicum]
MTDRFNISLNITLFKDFPLNREYNNNTMFSKNTKDIIVDEHLQTIGLIILLVLFFTIIIGNLTVLGVIFSRKIKTQMKIFIINLAITDIFVALGGILPEIIWNITIGFYAPTFVCKLVKYMSTTITYGSSFALIALSIDRAEAVCRPLRATSSKFSKKTHALILIGFAWLAAVICGVPTVFLAQKVYEGTQYENCRFDFSKISPQAYLTSIAMSVFVIPAFIIAACHIVIVIKIWHASKSRKFRINDLPDLRQKQSQENQSSNPLSLTTISISNKKLNEFSVDKKSLRMGLSRRVNRKHVHSNCISRAKVKTVKMTCLIVSTYVICWCPFMVWNLLVTYGYMRRYAPYLMKYSPIIQHLVPLNSTVNPAIFWIFNAENFIRRRRRTTAVVVTDATKF